MAARVHLKPVILLFLPQIAISYVTLDRTMLNFASTKDVRIYDQGPKLAKDFVDLVTSLGGYCLEYRASYPQGTTRLLTRCTKCPFDL